VLLAHPRYQLYGAVDNEGFFDGVLRYDNAIKKRFKHHGLGGAGESPLCGAFTTEIRVWDRDRDGLDPLALQLGQSVTEVRRTLNDYCGVSIYRDGFRVHPYGQRGNDWLNLDNRSRQNPVLRLANNQIVAAIKISRDTNRELRDRSTREGLVMNESYNALVSWFKEVLKEIEAYRYDVRPREQKDTTKEPLFEAFDIRDTVSQARTALGPDHQVAALITQMERQVNEGVERVQEVFSRLLMSAGLGQMVDIVIHEIGAPIGKINRQIEVLERRVIASKDQKFVETVAPMITSINGWLEQVHNLRDRLNPQTAGRRGRASRFNVQDEVEDTFRLYGALLEGQDITWTIEHPSDPLQVFMARAALGQVLANLVDNAIFWLIRGKGSGKGGTIEAKIERFDHGFTVTVSDDGPGVTEEDRSRIFEPYFTRKPNGIGLGLYIARLVIEPYGRLLYKEVGVLGGATFEAEFDHGVGL
jgi:signal transduction histidine kinase